MDNRPQLQIRIDPDLLEALKTAADERVVSVNLLVNKAIEDYLSRLIPINKMTRTIVKGR